MRERDIERKLVQAVKAADGLCLKFISDGTVNGYPDRICLLPGGRIAWVEVKAPGKKPRPLQTARHEKLRSLGFSVFILDDPGQIGGMLDEIRTT